MKNQINKKNIVTVLSIHIISNNQYNVFQSWESWYIVKNHGTVITINNNNVNVNSINKFAIIALCFCFFNNDLLGNWTELNWFLKVLYTVATKYWKGHENS